VTLIRCGVVGGGVEFGFSRWVGQLIRGVGLRVEVMVGGWERKIEGLKERGKEKGDRERRRGKGREAEKIGRQTHYPRDWRRAWS
jgi:hypothetical protein